MLAVVAQSIPHGLTSWWAPALAFAAGAVSFASPCVFPLVPGYLSYITGRRAAQEDASGPPSIVPMLLFIAGFTIVFTLFGAFATVFVKIFRGTPGRVVGGAIVIGLGLLMIAYGLRRGPLAIFAERRPFLGRVRPGSWGALPLGMAFAAGWTPCIGPALTGILAIAGSQDTARGVFLLVCYSLGLGLPFLLVGLGVNRMMGAFGWVQRRYAWIAGISGTVLVGIGILLATGLFTRVFAPLAKYAPGL